jgi:hypothetical protein
MSDTEIHQMFLLAAFFADTDLGRITIGEEKVTVKRPGKPDTEIPKEALPRMSLLELGDRLKEGEPA